MSARSARSHLNTYTYFHVCAKGNGGQVIFADDKDRLRYLSCFEKYRLQFRLQCFAFCLMSNHIHLLVLSPSIQLLSRAIHATHVAYAMYFNCRHDRSGHLFQDRFTSSVIKDEIHLLAAKEYVEQNPVKAGLAELKEGYRWSSACRDGSPVTLDTIRP